MKIYIGNLPGRITKNELWFFINSHQRHPVLALLLKEEAQINGLEIISTVSETGQVACYGVAHAFPRKNAYKLIARLDGKVLKGRTVEVREYFVRKQALDRRESGWELQSLDKRVDRRTKERRKAVRLDDWRER